MLALNFDRRQLRRTAWATLMVWLFALATGVANACVLTPAGPAERAVGQASHADFAHHGSHHDHDAAQPVTHHGHEHDSGKGTCLKFCDDESSAIAKVKLPIVDLGSSLLTVVEPWNPVAAASGVGFRQSTERLGAQGPPLVIRFLRLTL